MLQDGIVKRYLNDRCPDPRLKLCPYRNALLQTADDFLWNYGIFNDLGRFDGLGEEMRFIVLRSMQEYPLQQIKTASRRSLIDLDSHRVGNGAPFVDFRPQQSLQFVWRRAHERVAGAF